MGEKYEFKSHATKRSTLKKLLPPHVLDTLLSQCLDLLCFAPSYWFFAK